MSKKGDDMPAPPDPVATANAQAQANITGAKETAKLNSYDIYGPQGNVTWTKDANGLPIAQNVNLSPTGQQIFTGQQDMQLDLMGRANQALGNVNNDAFTTAGMPYDPRQRTTDGLPTFNTDNVAYTPDQYGDMKDYTSQVGDAFMDSQSAKLNPVFQQQRDRLNNDLQQRGIAYGDEAWQKAQTQLDGTQNDSWEQAARNATLAAGGEASRVFGMEQQLGSTDWNRRLQEQQQRTSDFGTQMQTEDTIRRASIEDELLGRTQNYNEALSYFNPVQLQMPQGYQRSSVNVAPAPIADLTMQGYNAQMQQYNARQQEQAGIWGAAGQGAQTAAMLAMWSSRALKTDDGPAETFLERVARLPVRTWRYDAAIEPAQPLHIGPYAEDWATLFGGDGQKISIPDVIGVCLKCIQELGGRVAKLELKGAFA